FCPCVRPRAVGKSRASEGRSLFAGLTGCASGGTITSAGRGICAEGWSDGDLGESLAAAFWSYETSWIELRAAACTGCEVTDGCGVAATAHGVCRLRARSAAQPNRTADTRSSEAAGLFAR